MDKPDITGLTEVPKSTDNDAVARLRGILFKHSQAAFHDNRLVFDRSRVFNHSTKDAYREYELIACMTITDNTGPSSLYGFTTNGKGIHSFSGEVTIYGTWAECYRKFVHDIRDHWAQIALDAETMAAPYRLLFSRLT